MRELEEERRLLYVAITRAEKHCILTCAQNRFRYGKMEYDTPSRFIRDIDPSLLRVEGSAPGISTGSSRYASQGISTGSSRYASQGNPAGASRYSGQSGYGKDTNAYRRPVQNPRPVATQFIADVKPRLVPVRQETPAPQSAIGNIGLREGNVIEHQRFGIGTVIKMEGSGENTKATVAFKNAGTKQLLLKFARYTIIS
jgi:DNA helicase-2/ATP-dependent DNA helicase PcrA